MAAVTKNGDLIYFVITVTNNGGFPNTGVTGQDILPPGLIRKTWSANKGSFNLSTGVWTVGNVPVGTSYTLTITYQVVDISLATDESGVYGFFNSFTVSGQNVDSNDINNTKTQFVEITTCPPSAGAVDDDSACLCGSVAGNDTECSHGETEYRIQSGSLVNLDPSFSLGLDGSYNAMGKILNPYAPASFSYSIWCIVAGNEYQTSGPALVTIPALFHSGWVANIDWGGLPEYESLQHAIDILGPGMPFVLAAVNLNGGVYRTVLVTPTS